MAWKLRDALAPLLVLGWGVAAVFLLFFVLAAPHRDASLALLSSAAMFALAYKVWRPGAQPWGTLPLVVLGIVPFLLALWLGTLLWAFAALPALALLVLPTERAPMLPRASGQAALVLVAAYLALAPALDGLALGPPALPAPTIASSQASLGPEGTQRLAGGAGAVWEQRVSQPGMADVSVVRITLAAGENASEALRDGYAPGGASGTFISWPFPFFLQASERTATATALADGWTRTAVRNESVFVFLFLPFPMSDAQRQLVLLRHVRSELRPSLLPPFATQWDEYAGYHLFQAGDNAAALRALDGNVYVAGERLDLPPQAYDDLAVGPLATPGFEVLALVGAGLVAARRRRR
jgi:hypothetical protein